METPKPQSGTWTLVAPDGRKFQADSPLHCCRAEQAERVPETVAAKRVLSILNENDSIDELISAYEHEQCGCCDHLLRD